MSWQLILILVLFVAGAPARALDRRSDFCTRASDPSFFISRAHDPRFRLHFANQGGLFDGGVCWWHSRLQRSIFYLAVLRPELKKPDARSVKSMLRRLASNSGIVEIPGYDSIDAFSRDWWPFIQRKLDEWQLADGFLRQAWLGNVTASTSVAPPALARRMDVLDDIVEGEHRIAWVMLKLAGIEAHAWLVVDMKPTGEGYELTVIDSNFPGDLKTVEYVRGSSSLRTLYGETVPYLGRESDFARFKAAMNVYCSGPEPGTYPVLSLENGWD